MRRKILLSLIAIIAVVSGVAALSAYEAHVINVTAKIENALRIIPPNQELAFGTVFPQEYFEKSFFITLSGSFIEQERVLNIDYKIVQKPKCVNPAGEYAPVELDTHECPAGYTEMPSLCPYLSKTPRYIDEEPYTDYGVPAFHDPDDPLSVATGIVNKDDDRWDEWIIDLNVPCFEGMCAQDWTHQGWELDPNLESETFGCDLWVEVTDIY